MSYRVDRTTSIGPLAGPRARLVMALALLILPTTFVTDLALGDDLPSGTIRDGFEGPENAWRQEQANATVKIYAHERSKRTKHEGEQAEGFEFDAGIGGGLYYSYALPKVPITDDLRATLYVRSNRAGIQFLARVILPSDVDPETHRPSYVMIPSTTYQTADRWQRIELTDMIQAAERQAWVLRASTKRKVSLEGAYLERIVANVYGGEGVTNVYLDDLTVGPVPQSLADAFDRSLRGPGAPGEPAEGAANADRPAARTVADGPGPDREPIEATPPGAGQRVRFDRNRLSKDGYPWFPTMFRAPETDPTMIRRIGADVLVSPYDSDDDYYKRAVASGLLLMPETYEPSDLDKIDQPLVDPDEVVSAASTFPFKDHVFAWMIGRNLGRSPNLADRKVALKRDREAMLAIRKARPGGSPLTTATVAGMVSEYARTPENLDMIGVSASHWGTAQGPLEFIAYLGQRKLLTARGNTDALIWSEIDVTPPPVYDRAIWGGDRPPEWGEARVQPEQIQIDMFAAIAAGCRGLCFRAEGDMERGLNRINAIEVALQNELIDVLEPILADPDRSIRMLDTLQPDPPKPPPMTFAQTNTTSTNRPPQVKEQPPHPSIKAAAITTKDRRGTLVMIADYARDSQFQPTQMASNSVRLIVPGANDALAYLISPGGVKPLESVRTVGGHLISLEDFGVTAVVLVTTNAELAAQIERVVQPVRVQAVNYAIEQAQLHRAWVADIDYRLRLDGHLSKDWADLIQAADARIKSASEAAQNENYMTAWEEARRVARPLRILMRAHFSNGADGKGVYDAIIKDLNDETLPCGPVAYEGKEKPQPRLISPVVVPALASFSTLPQAWVTRDNIRRGRLGENLVPSGNFSLKDRDDAEKAGWTVERYETPDLVSQYDVRDGGVDNPKQEKGKGKNLVLAVEPRKGLTVDSVVPFSDRPVIAVRSPSVPVRAREMYRISVMAHSSSVAAPGAGGLIVRDSIGGERLQYRTSLALSQDWYEIVLYRLVPEDGELSVLLGMANVSGNCTFDDFKIEPVVEFVDPEQYRLTNRPRSRSTKTPKVNADGSVVDDPAEKAPRTSSRPQPLPFR